MNLHTLRVPQRYESRLLLHIVIVYMNELLCQGYVSCQLVDDMSRVEATTVHPTSSGCVETSILSPYSFNEATTVAQQLGTDPYRTEFASK